MPSPRQKGVFISYRRSVHMDFARSLYLELTARGYDVFFDMESVTGGHLHKVILPQIERRAHFLLLIARGTLDGCNDPSDWVRQEFEKAIEHKRHIVPLLDGITLEELKPLLTGSFSTVSRWHAMTFHHDDFKGSMRRIYDNFRAAGAISVPSKPLKALQEAYDRLSELVRITPKIISGYVNGLGMRFLEFGSGKSLMMAQVPTQLGTYRKFAEQTGRDYRPPLFDQDQTHPVVQVSWDDANAFCAWLTKTERGRGAIGISDHYRLPTDHEWSQAVGIGDQEDPRASAQEKDGKLDAHYPWGNQWPPPAQAGNYAPVLGLDRHRNTSPVGIHPANGFGLLDMGGNVWEWCADYYVEGKTRVIRGGSFKSNDRADLLSSRRNRRLPDSTHDDVGFRCIMDLQSKAG